MVVSKTYNKWNMNVLLSQYSPVPRARGLIAGKDATRPVGARVAREQIYAGLGSNWISGKWKGARVARAQIYAGLGHGR